MRNIVSLRVSQDLFDDLSDRPADWDAAIALELATKPPAFTSAQPVLHRPFEEARWNDAIHYPFRHWMRSRYSDGSFGVWYGADSIETTVHETVHHWRSGFLQDAGFTRPGIRVERKLYRVRCDAALLDLRPALAQVPALVDPADYSLTQQIGARLHREGTPAWCRARPVAMATSTRCSTPACCPIRARCAFSPTHHRHRCGVEREPGRVWMRLGA
jgi:hypothetical protein